MDGFLRRSEIELNDRQLRATVARGALTRCARGWLALPGADREVAHALALGVRVTCLSAARLYGLWVPNDAISHRLHVAIRDGDPVPVRPRSPQPLVVHRLRSTGWGTTEPIVPIEVCLDQTLRHHSIETGLMLLESAVDRGRISPLQADRLIAGQSVRKRGAGLQHFDSRSGSGSETRVRLWFQRRNCRVRTQVSIAGVGRVDMLVGASLVIEVDSWAHHSTPEAYADDRRRDLALSALGFHRIRLTYQQVFEEWPTTVRLLRLALSHGWQAWEPAEEALISVPELRWAA